MCGACGARATTWTERVAPLDPRGARRRAAALRELVAARPGGGRVGVVPWAGGALTLRFPTGDVLAPSLPAAADVLTRRLGPLVAAGTVAPADGSSPEQVAVWCAAAHAAGLRTTVRAAGVEVRVADAVTVRAS